VDRTAVITGSSSGIGHGIAKGLAAAGYNIVLNGIEPAEQIEPARKALEDAHGIKAIYSPSNMMKPEGARELIAAAQAAFGYVDVLVNNAGIQYVAPIEEFPDDKWEAIMSLNLSAAFYTTKAVVAGMKERKRGRIINIASAHGLVASPYKSAYVAAKHGIVGMTKTVALEVAEHGVTVNAICPGYVWTPLVEKQIPSNPLSKRASKQAPPRDTQAAMTERKKINLALQGGGAHGAFTWGVLDRILEDGRLEIDAISGTSAGAMNAVALAAGFAEAGAQGARDKLAQFWRAMSDAANGSPIKRTPFDIWMGNWSLDKSWGFHAMDAMSRVFSPYQLNSCRLAPHPR